MGLPVSVAPFLLYSHWLKDTTYEPHSCLPMPDRYPWDTGIMGLDIQL